MKTIVLLLLAVSAGSTSLLVAKTPRHGIEKPGEARARELDPLSKAVQSAEGIQSKFLQLAAAVARYDKTANMTKPEAEKWIDKLMKLEGELLPVLGSVQSELEKLPEDWVNANVYVYRVKKHLADAEAKKTGEVGSLKKELVEAEKSLLQTAAKHQMKPATETQRKAIALQQELVTSDVSISVMIDTLREKAGIEAHKELPVGLELK